VVLTADAAPSIDTFAVPFPVTVTPFAGVTVRVPFSTVSVTRTSKSVTTGIARSTSVTASPVIASGVSSSATWTPGTTFTGASLTAFTVTAMSFVLPSGPPVPVFPRSSATT